MSVDVRELLPLYALGILDADEISVVERAVAADPALATELASYQRTAEALVAPVEPPPELEARLLASVGGGAFERFASRLTTLFDVSLDRARELLGLIERPASWNAQLPGISLVHFAGGPAYATADCGFIRLEPGTTFPWHKHVGEEVSVILAGALRDHEGRRYLPGDELVQRDTSEHGISCDGSEPCMFAVRAIDGIEVGGAPARPTRN